jgi:hypothetical protein
VSETGLQKKATQTRHDKRPAIKFSSSAAVQISFTGESDSWSQLHVRKLLPHVGQKCRKDSIAKLIPSFSGFRFEKLQKFKTLLALPCHRFERY